MQKITEDLKSDKVLKTCSACGLEHEEEKCPNGCQDTNRSGILIL
jgi:recombinational DNA repair protein RecR